MEYQYQVLLQQWGLSDCIEAFVEEGITDDSFKLIDEDSMNCLIKKRGPLLIFKNKFQEHMGKKLMKDIMSEDSSGSTETMVSSEYQGDSDDEFVQILNVEIPEQVINEPIFKIPEIPSLKSESVPKKFKASEEDFEDLLNRTAEGRIILANKRKLSNDLRQKLAKIVVNDLVSKYMKNGKIELRSDVFVKAAENIVAVFPTESIDTYYIPYSSPKTGLRQPARGKLWSRYVNVKAALRTAESHSLSRTVQENKENIISRLPEEAQNDLIFLKSAIEPYTKVLQAWEDTCELRMQLYKNKGVDDIYKDFPCLKTERGIELLECDFNNLYPDKIDIIYSEWPNISLAIIKEANERNISLASDVNLDTSLHALLLIPLLFSPVTIKKSSKKNWRPTRLEIQESFFFIAKDPSSIEETIERRKRKLQMFDVPLQPFAVGLGHIGDNSEVNHFFIYINECRYRCESSIRCLELLFKAIHGLNLEYPPESKHIWLFIQEMVFKMTTSKNSSTACIIADIKYHLNSD